MSAIQALLQGSIDYAGLFPPAGLDMGPAVANYAKYHSGPAAWALGRFIVPVSRLLEFEAHLPSATGGLWRLGVLAGTDLRGDLTEVAQFNRRHSNTGATAVVADVIEVKAGSEARIAEIMQLVPQDLQAYIEIPIDEDPTALVAAIGRLGGRAKVRTGGVTPEAFPSTRDLLRFLQASTRAGVALKATAGLHHPLRAEFRLTYASDSPRGTMFGFLNLFLTVAFLRAGMNEALAARLLEEESPEAFQADAVGISWRNHRVDLPLLHQVRNDGIISFGSCSFTEPIQDLESLHLIESPAHRA